MVTCELSLLPYNKLKLYLCKKMKICLKKKGIKEGMGIKKEKNRKWIMITCSIYKFAYLFFKQNGLWQENLMPWANWMSRGCPRITCSQAQSWLLTRTNIHLFQKYISVSIVANVMSNSLSFLDLRRSLDLLEIFNFFPSIICNNTW